MSEGESKEMDQFLVGIPKVELHLHIEGTLEADLMLRLAKRNKVELKYNTIEKIQEAKKFTNLQSFLDLYYSACSVLLKEQDFFDLAWAYFERCRDNEVHHTEIFFDPQTHTDRGVPFDVVINGLHRAALAAQEKLNISCLLILCFLRHLSADAASATLTQALKHTDKFVAVGLDSGEQGNPPSKFKAVFARVREAGLRVVAHAGEEGPPAYITEALDLLKADRIDHGVRCLEDAALVKRLAKSSMPLTVCPLSNHRLQVFKRFFKGENCVRNMLDRGLVVTLNSDDPAYFGGYMVDNFRVTARECRLTKHEVLHLCLSAARASFCSAARREELMKAMRAFAADH